MDDVGQQELTGIWCMVRYVWDLVYHIQMAAHKFIILLPARAI